MKIVQKIMNWKLKILFKTASFIQMTSFINAIFTDCFKKLLFIITVKTETPWSNSPIHNHQSVYSIWIPSSHHISITTFGCVFQNCGVLFRRHPCTAGTTASTSSGAPWCQSLLRPSSPRSFYKRLSPQLSHQQDINSSTHCPAHQRWRGASIPSVVSAVCLSIQPHTKQTNNLGRLILSPTIKDTLSTLFELVVTIYALPTDDDVLFTLNLV